jgi:hypothetical protein
LKKRIWFRQEKKGILCLPLLLEKCAAAQHLAFVGQLDVAPSRLFSLLVAGVVLEPT